MIRCFLFFFIGLSILPVSVLLAQTAPEDQKGTRTVYLIRHGQYDHDDQRDAEIGKGLVPIGMAQARLLGARLRSMPVKFSALYSSSMTRAHQTARILNEDFPGLKLQVTRDLRECTPPTWRKDVMDESEPVELEECRARLEKNFEAFFTPSPDQNDRHDILVCHGNVIRYLATRVLKVDPMAWLQMSVGNCSITVIRIKADGSMRLVVLGDVGHLPPNLQTGSVRDTKENLLVLPQD